MWCYLEMAGPESQSSDAGAAIEFNRVEETLYKNYVCCHFVRLAEL